MDELFNGELFEEISVINQAVCPGYDFKVFGVKFIETVEDLVKRNKRGKTNELDNNITPIIITNNFLF
jgi:hypothetical protein